MTIEPLLPSATHRHVTRRVRIGDVVVGGDPIPVIAGPCAVETGYVEHAVAAHRGRRQRASRLRAQAAHPSWVVPGDRARRAAAARRGTTTHRPASDRGTAGGRRIDVLRDHVDALMIGARSMHNTPLLRAAGQSGMPVIVKRGMSATYDELLAAAEYVTGEGNTQVILCERGIRTFETATRNTPRRQRDRRAPRADAIFPSPVDPSARGRQGRVGPVACGRRIGGRRRRADHRERIQTRSYRVRRGAGDHPCGAGADRRRVARALRNDAAGGHRDGQRLSAR